MKKLSIFNAIDTTKIPSNKYIPKLKREKRKKVKKKKIRRPRKTIRSYKKYLESHLWVNRKNRYFQRYGKICQACGKKKFVTLHHKIYRDNYGDEPDSEVVALCMLCHQTYHDIYGVQKDMILTTNEFLKEMKENRLLVEEDYLLEQNFVKNL